MDNLSPIKHDSRKMDDGWNILDWRPGQVPGCFGTPIVQSYTPGQSESYIPSWVTTVILQSNGGSTGLQTPKLRFTNESGLDGNSTRLLYPIVGSECHNGEIRALFMSRFRNTYPLTSADQLGFGFRYTTDPNNGNRPWGYVLWHDGLYSVESMWNINWWRRDAAGGHGAAGEGAGGGVYDMPGLQIFRSVYFGSKIGNQITLNLGANHGVVAGDNVSVQTDEVDENIINVVSDNQSVGTITLTSATTATNPIYNTGVGRVMNRSVMPYYGAARLIDDVFQAKFWRVTAAETDWNSNDNVVRMINPTSGADAGPQGRGQLGIIANHLVDTSHFVDYGSVWWRSLD